MRYLYGDSSDSPIESNVIALLRETLDASVQILLATQRIAAGAGFGRAMTRALPKSRQRTLETDMMTS